MTGKAAYKDSHSINLEDYRILGYDAISNVIYVQTFRMFYLPPTLAQSKQAYTKCYCLQNNVDGLTPPQKTGKTALNIWWPFEERYYFRNATKFCSLHGTRRLYDGGALTFYAAVNVSDAMRPSVTS